MKATLLLTVGLTMAGSALGSKCKPSKPSSISSVSSSSVSPSVSPSVPSVSPSAPSSSLSSVPSSSPSSVPSSSPSSVPSSVPSSSPSLAPSSSPSSVPSSSSSSPAPSSPSSSPSSSSSSPAPSSPSSSPSSSASSPAPSSPSSSPSPSASPSSSVKPSSSSASPSSVPSNPPSGPVCSGNIIKDGDFSDQFLSPHWASLGIYAASVARNCNGNGVSCAHLKAPGLGSSFISQTVTTTKNTKYQVTFSYQILGQSKNPTITVSQGINVIQTISLQGQASNVWLTSTPVEFTSSKLLTLTTLSFGVNAAFLGNGDVDITNIVVSKCT